MRRLATKRNTLILITFSVCLAIAGAGSPAYAARDCANTNPTCRPYFKSFGADVFTGGYLSLKDGTCNPGSANYQFGSVANQVAGGILAYAKSRAVGSITAGNGGASSQYGAFALGQIEGNPANTYGFYSNGARSSASVSVDSLAFANTTGSWGGMFASSAGQAHCIPDYFDTMQKNPSPIAANNINLSTLGPGQHLATPPANTIVTLTASAPIPAGKSQTLFIDGNVYINSDITYQLDKDINVPKLALIVQGSIYIAPGVQHLDGVYIAQPILDPANSQYDPSPGSKDVGMIWTCHPPATATSNPSFFGPDGNLLYIWPTFNCQTNKLTVQNGAFIARQINLLRVIGDVNDNSQATVAEDARAAALSDANQNLAEVFNYSPAIPLGGPFFTTDTTVTNLRVDSLVSLPPVF